MFPDNDNYSFAEKWSAEIANYNFTQVPNLLLSCQGHLKLKDGELLTLIHLLTFWFIWDGEIYPTIMTLTKFSNKGYSTVQKRLRNLEEKGFIQRCPRLYTSNEYDLKPCVKKLQEHLEICEKLPLKRGEYREKTVSPLPSLPINKEYQHLTILNKENLRNEDIFGNFFGGLGQ